MNLVDLETRLETFGLHLRGVLKPDAEEADLLQVEANSDVLIALIGNIGSSYWPVFSQSLEYRDGQPDSLDRWSSRVAQQVAQEYRARAIFPFEGPPYYPFLRWAERAGALSQSPLGLMIHPRYGLWHSYRFGLLISQLQIADQQNNAVASLCQKCATQPCLHSCPVDAFSDGGYDVGSCAAYLKQTGDALCHQQGCLARLACPVGEEYRYESAQHTFHLRAFLGVR